MQRGFLKTVLILVIAGGALYFAYDYFFRGPNGPAGPPGGAPPVSVAEVISRDVQLWQEFSGRLVAVDSAEIRPRVSGIIEQVHFKEGQWVAKGQPLFTIDQRPYVAALQAAEAQAGLTEAELTRADLLLSDKAISQREYDQRKNAAAAARAALTQAKLNYDYSVVNAPIAGRVGRPELTVGNLVDAGGNAPVLTTVVSYNPIYADFEIDEQAYLRYLQSVGADAKKLQKIPVTLTLSGKEDTVYEGHVQSFDNRLDPRSGTVRVRAIFDNKEGTLIPGLFARVQLGSPGETPVILITDRAIGTDQSKKFVLVVGDDNMANYRPITLGSLVDGLRVVESGLQPGEKIIVNGLQRARPGTPVTPEMVPMEQGPHTGAQPPAQPVLPEAKEEPPPATPDEPDSEL